MALLMFSSSYANKKDRANLNLEAFEFARKVGLMEVRRIMGDLYVSPDCHRIWDGKTPFGDHIIKKDSKDIAIRMTEDICEDWVNDLAELFKSYGYQSSSEVFKAPDFKDYVWNSPEAKIAHQRASIIRRSNYKGNAFGGVFTSKRVPVKKRPNTQYCFWMPISQQQYFPSFEVLTRLGKVENWYHKTKSKEARVITHQGVSIPLEDNTPKCKPIPVK